MSYLVTLARSLRQPFVASVVDAGTGTRLAVGAANYSNPLLHGETDAIKAYVALGLPKTTPLALYTTAESCPMCAAAEVWAGIELVVYGSSRPALVKDGGWGPFTMRAETVFANAAASNVAGYPAVCQVGGVLASATDPLFVHA